MIGLVIINEIDIDEAFEIVSSAWNYRNFEYNDFIEVLDMLEEERRVWIDWEDNTYGKRGYSRMIYYTNIGTIAPDNSYLVFNAEGSILGQLSGSFVSNLRGGDVILWAVQHTGSPTFKVRVSMFPVSQAIAQPFLHGPVKHDHEAENYHPRCYR